MRGHEEKEGTTRDGSSKNAEWFENSSATPELFQIAVRDFWKHTKTRPSDRPLVSSVQSVSGWEPPKPGRTTGPDGLFVTGTLDVNFRRAHAFFGPQDHKTFGYSRELNRDLGLVLGRLEPGRGPCDMESQADCILSHCGTQTEIDAEIRTDANVFAELVVVDPNLSLKRPFMETRDETLTDTGIFGKYLRFVTTDQYLGACALWQQTTLTSVRQVMPNVLAHLIVQYASPVVTMDRLRKERVERWLLRLRTPHH
jgi:hypothetical protein